MRDVGGLPTTDGGAIVTGRLIRSDNLQELPPASVRHLVDDLGVTDVVDLRTYVEVAKEGDGPLVAEPGVQFHHHTLYTEDTKESGIPAGERRLPWETDRNMGTAAKVRRPKKGSHGETGRSPGSAKEDRKHDAYWSKHYLGYLDRRPDSVVAALRAIGEADGAVVVHCAAGKDRTGTVVGLALLVAGVTPEAVVADYAASAERVPRILERLGPASRVRGEPRGQDGGPAGASGRDDAAPRGGARPRGRCRDVVAPARLDRRGHRTAPRQAALAVTTRGQSLPA